MSGILKLNGVDYMGGGGGNAKEEIITYAQYLALSEEQRNNGTTYYVNDINGDGEDFQPIIYSTDEREVGVWIDGRPLYQKTFNTTTPSSVNLSTIVIDISNLNINNIITMKGFLYSSGLNQFIPIEFPFSTAILVSTYIENYKIIQKVPSSDYTSCPESITIQYTKTTDAPGSGTWTPQGVPAQHYSTNEQIVGTWIDGKILYEKTYKFTAPSGATAGTALISVADLSINYVASLQAIAVNPTTHRTWPLSSNYSNGGGIVILSGNDNNDNIEYRCYNDNFAGYELIVTIRYTKSS